MGKKLTVDNPAVYSLIFLEHIQFKNTNEILVINIMLNVNGKEKKCFEDNQQNEPPKKIYSWNKFWVPKFNDIVRGRIIRIPIVIPTQRWEPTPLIIAHYR